MVRVYGCTGEGGWIYRFMDVRMRARVCMVTWWCPGIVIW
mgnify:CR=1 FL=1